MNCLQADGLIQEALDGTLTARERETLDAHLATCADCRAAWDEYRSLARTATVWTRRPIHEADPGEAFTANVMAQIASRPSVALDPAPLSVWQRLVVAGLVLAVLLACGVLFPLSPLPAAPPADFLPSPQAALGLPRWLWANVSALPAATARLWEGLTGSLTVSGTMLALLTAALLLNGLLYARTVREPRGPLAR